MNGIFCVAAALAIAAAPEQADEAPVLRVLTYNVWGIPIITPARAARVRAIGDAIAEVEPDLVALQEVWMPEDGVALSRALARHGLVHSRHFAGTFPGGSGLLIASRYPFREEHFRRYSQGKVPHTPWHLDWIADKGAARVVVQTPAGDVDFAATHLQAGYGTDEYVTVQLSQMLEVAELLGAISTGPARPLILAGDLNADFSALPFRVLAARAGLSATDERCGIDAILYRSGSGIRIETRAVTRVFDEPRDIAGQRQRLSDHGGVLAELVLHPVDEPGQALAVAADRWKRVVQESTATVMGRLDRARDDLVKHRLLSGAMFLLTFGALLSRRRWPRVPRALSWSGLALAIVASWYLYLGLAYGPSEIADLTALQSQLSTLP